MVTNEDMFGKFQHLLQKNDAFHGMIVVLDDDDIQKDGGAKKLFTRVVKKPAVNLIRKITKSSGQQQQQHEDDDPQYGLTIDQYTDDQRVLKFYYHSKIMEAVDSSVYMKTLVSPTTPKEGKFMIECPSQDDSSCSRSISGTPSHMKNEDDEYLVLNKASIKLTCVHKDRVTDDEFFSLITIYNTEQDRPDPDQPDTAIYFADEKHHYYLVPQDCMQPECTIMVKKVDVEKLNDDEIDTINRKHLSFLQKYSNSGSIAKAGIASALHSNPRLPWQQDDSSEFKLSGKVVSD